MGDDTDLVRPATSAEAADVGAMHAANRAAWDEAAERYAGWFDEAVALIRSGGTNLFGVETELIGERAEVLVDQVLADPAGARLCAR